MSAEAGPRYRSSALDRALAGARTVSVIGPVRGLLADDVRVALRRLVEGHPGSRLDLIPDPSTRRWDRRLLLDEGAVTEWPATEDVADLVTSVRRRPGPRSPIEVVVAGEYLVLDASHGLGDGQLTVAIMLALVAGRTNTRWDPVVTSVMRPRSESLALWRAIGGSPTRIRDVIRLRREHSGSDERTRVAPAGYRGSIRMVLSRMHAEQIAELSEWARVHAPGATTAALSTSLYAAALANEGIAYDDRQMVLIDCRRYLPEADRAGHGNFAVGIPLRFGQNPDPSVVAEKVRAVTTSGWPAVTLAMGEVKSRLRGPATAGDGAPVERCGDRIRLAVSDMGRPRVLDSVDWAENAGPPLVNALIDPDGPDALTLCVLETAGVRSVTATFHEDIVDRERVQAALDRASADPVPVLSAERVL